jgi:exonuclease SbcC
MANPATCTQCSAELEQVQKYLAQLQTKQSSLQQELEQAFNLNQLH